MRLAAIALTGALIILVPAASSAPGPDAAANAIASICTASAYKPSEGKRAITMQPGMGSGGFAISANREAQTWFDYGLKLYHAFYHEDAKRAFTKAARVVIQDPKAATAVVKERDGIVNAELEERRLRLAIDSAIATPDAKAEGFGAVSGPRLALMASQVADAYATKGRINPDAVWNGGFLPAAAARDIFGAASKASAKK